MPCFGGGAIATSDEGIAERAEKVLAGAATADTGAIIKQAASIWAKWLLTRPLVFGFTAYPVLRLKLALGKPLMDSAVGDELLHAFVGSQPRVTRMSNLQAALGLLQLQHIDRFNEGARENANALTEALGAVPTVRPPKTSDEHVYVYYPLSVDADRRDDLRSYLLRHGVDSKTSDMSDCTRLKAFRDEADPGLEPAAGQEASILEICVYPVIPKRRMEHIAHLIRSWASRPTAHD
jgi:dTDP-4-amino-4,6-dideoxygalactose transaminase